MLLSYDQNKNKFLTTSPDWPEILLVRFGVICLLPDTEIWTEKPRKVASLLTGSKLTIMLSMITQ